MSDAGPIGAFLACFLFCPSEGLFLQRGEPLPTLQGTRYDCAEAPRAANTWYGLFVGRHSTSDYTRTISVRGCFPTEGECELVLDRLDGFVFGNVTRSCTFRTPPS